jgi:hypothetical protein
MRRGWVLGAVAASCLVGAQALAGVVITMESGPTGDKTRTHTMSLESDRLRIAGGHDDMIYRADLSKVWILNSGDRTYREMTPETMQHMRAQMEGAMQQMQQQLQSMPPEQRKQVEAMMAKRGMGGMPGAASGQLPQVTYEKAGGSKTVGKWSCTPYKVSINGEDRTQMCIARLSDLGLNRDDFKAFSQFGTFMQSMMAAPGAEKHGPAGAFDFDGMSKAIGYDGFPVETAHLSADGKVEAENTIKSIDRTSIPADSFEVPAGYTKQDMSMGRMLPAP